MICDFGLAPIPNVVKNYSSIRIKLAPHDHKANIGLCGLHSFLEHINMSFKESALNYIPLGYGSLLKELAIIPDKMKGASNLLAGR